MTDLRYRTLLLCADATPRPDGDGASRRLYHFVQFLRAAGCGVTCVTRCPQGVDAGMGRLTDMGAKVVVVGDEHVEALARSECFDWALLGGWSVAEPLVAPLRAASPATRIVVDAGDIDLRRHARQMRREAAGRPGRFGEAFMRVAARELGIYAAADAVLAASRRDADLLADLVGDRLRIFLVPDSEDLAASPFPFRRRRGMFFVGDFAHPHNFAALAWLCDEVLPHVDPALLAAHPLSVAGRHATDEIRAITADRPTVRMLGRVPSVIPYLERARVSLVPLPHRAGSRRKLLQALAIGTPTVTTPAGIEGFSVADEREVLVADEPVRFAAGITRLLTDEPLWNDIARAGRERVRVDHGPETTRRQLQEALVAIRAAAPAVRRPDRRRRMSNHDYEAAIRRARDAIERVTPPGATIAVVSRGDEEAVKLAGRTGWHFPLGEDGDYAGFHPANGSEAVDHLEAVRRRGAGFLAIPLPFLWWLDHYRDLRSHLESHYRVIETDGGDCVVVSLREPPAGPQSLASLATEEHAVADDRPPTIVFEGLSDRHAVTRAAAGPPPAISVVIATRNRAALLAEVLNSLERQTVEAAAFEVVVVADGAADGTAAACRDAAGRLRLTLVESPPVGLAAARNLGVAAATAPLVLFLDDDVVADPGLVAAHLAAHRRFPLEHVAALGSRAWHPRLLVTELMRFVADEGHAFGGPPPRPAGPPLDHTHFRAGGSSCKKSLLVRAGGFRRALSGGMEDLEAGHRIGRMLACERPRASGFDAAVGLAVIACGDAVQHVIRPPTFAEVCDRCERRGRSLRHFSRVADDPRVDEWLGVRAADERWRELREALDAKVARVRGLEREVETAGPDRERLVRELQLLYRWTFDAFTMKGVAEAAGAS